MPRIVVLLVVIVAACGPAATAPVATPSAAPSVEPSAVPFVTETPTPAPATPAPVQMPVVVPLPDVVLQSQTFPMGVPPTAHQIPLAQLNPNTWNGWAVQLMQFLDMARGGGPYKRIGPMSDEEWNSRIWPGEFQKVARAVAATKPPEGRFFYSDSFAVDAAWSLPWSVPNGNGATVSLQFIDVTMKFRDHAETAPAEGELFYTWHLRLPTEGFGVYAVADGYDDVHARSWMNGATYYDRPRLEREATSALGAYLWGESYLAGSSQKFANVQDTTPFWHSRIEALNGLNALFNAGRLTERRFEGARVRIDGFEPLTAYGGGIVTVTLTGRLVETLDGKTIRVDFTQPMKFYRFANSPTQLAGWTAIDSFEDGAWVSGGNLALDKLSTAHG